MSFGPSLTLISETLPVQRRDFSLAVPGLLDPNNANPLLQGEWLGLNASYQLVRGTGEQSKPTWQVYTERGRYDTQAIGKADVLFLGGYEAETTVCDLTGASIGDPLVVTDVTIGGLVKQGLKKPSGTGAHGVVAYVTRLPGGGVVRFWRPGGLNEITL
jgi:hypothetical protein